MNWKKILTFIASSAVVGGLGGYVQNPAQPFNFHTVGIPILTVLLGSLTALFTHAPQNDATALGQSNSTFPGPRTDVTVRKP